MAGLRAIYDFLSALFDPSIQEVGDLSFVSPHGIQVVAVRRVPHDTNSLPLPIVRDAQLVAKGQPM